MRGIGISWPWRRMHGIEQLTNAMPCSSAAGAEGPGTPSGVRAWVAASTTFAARCSRSSASAAATLRAKAARTSRSSFWNACRSGSSDCRLMAGGRAAVRDPQTAIRCCILRVRLCGINKHVSFCEFLKWVRLKCADRIHDFLHLRDCSFLCSS